MTQASLIFSIPGKTFLAGEYAVLKGGKALIAATEPRFEMQIARGSGELEHIHADSPAGKFIQAYPLFFKQFDISFVDSFGHGGLGASTAQFLAVYAFYQWQGQALLESEKYLDHQQMLRTYRECAWNGEGFAPSGADLIGQERGHLTLLDKSSGRLSNQSWNFQNLGFYLVLTGVKLATHEHLRLGTPFDPQKMIESFELIQQSLDINQQKREELFVSGINAYAAALEAENLTSEHSLQLLEKLRRIPGVLAAKACGAMGVDVLFVVTGQNQDLDLRKYLRENSLKMIATEKNLSGGLQSRLLKGDLF